MPTDLDKVLWDLEEQVETREEPNVLVDPTMEAFCEMRSRMARGSTPPPAPVGSGRLSLDAIKAYLIENADPDEPELTLESP